MEKIIGLFISGTRLSHSIGQVISSLKLLLEALFTILESSHSQDCTCKLAEPTRNIHLFLLLGA